MNYGQKERNARPTYDKSWLKNPCLRGGLWLLRVSRHEIATWPAWMVRAPRWGLILSVSSFTQAFSLGYHKSAPLELGSLSEFALHGASTSCMCLGTDSNQMPCRQGKPWGQRQNKHQAPTGRFMLAQAESLGTHDHQQTLSPNGCASHVLNGHEGSIPKIALLIGRALNVATSYSGYSFPSAANVSGLGRGCFTKAELPWNPTAMCRGA